MKICITSQGDNLNAPVDPRFGRCAYFVISDTETSDFEAIKNPNLENTGGVGVQSSQLIANKNVKVVITGNVGPNAFQTLQAAGVEIITGVTGSIKDAIEKYKNGEFKLTQNSNVNSKFGIQQEKS